MLGPGQAIWLPANVVHQATCRTDLAFQVVYVAPSLIGADTLPCKMFDASSLVRGLVDEIVAMTFNFDMDERMSAIARLLVDEVARAPRIADRFLFPSDPRLRRVCEAITAQPGIAAILITGRGKPAWHGAHLPGFSSRKWVWALLHGGAGSGWWRQPPGLLQGNPLRRSRLTLVMIMPVASAPCFIARLA